MHLIPNKMRTNGQRLCWIKCLDYVQVIPRKAFSSKEGPVDFPQKQAGVENEIRLMSVGVHIPERMSSFRRCRLYCEDLIVRESRNFFLRAFDCWRTVAIFLPRKVCGLRAVAIFLPQTVCSLRAVAIYFPQNILSGIFIKTWFLSSGCFPCAHCVFTFCISMLGACAL